MSMEQIDFARLKREVGILARMLSMLEGDSQKTETVFKDTPDLVNHLKKELVEHLKKTGMDRNRMVSDYIPASVEHIDALITKLLDVVHHTSLDRQRLDALRNYLMDIKSLPPENLDEVAVAEELQWLADSFGKMPANIRDTVESHGSRQGGDATGESGKMAQPAATGAAAVAGEPKERVKASEAETGESDLPDRNDETRDDLLILTDPAAVVYEILCELPAHRGLIGSELLQKMDERNCPSDQRTLTSRIIPELKPYGVKNARRKGYHIPPSKRPKPQT